MRALLCILIPKSTRDNISRLQVPYPGSEWLEPESLALPLFWLEDIHGNDIIDLIQEFELFDHPPFELTLGNIDITSAGQVYLQFNIPSDFISKLRTALKSIKKQNIRAALNRLNLGIIPSKSKNKFIELALSFNETFITEHIALWEDGKFYFEKARFPFIKKSSGPRL